jgi:MFS family permease
MNPTISRILVTGQYGRKFFTVRSQHYMGLLCMYNSLVRSSISRTDCDSTIGTSTYVAALPFVILQFNIGRTVALLPIVLYTVGFAVGPLIAAPLSELYGRRLIYWTNLPMLVIFNAIAAASDNLAVLIIFRFLAGVGGSGVLAVGAGNSSHCFVEILYSQSPRYYCGFMGFKERRSSRINIYPGSFPRPIFGSACRRIYRCAIR